MLQCRCTFRGSEGARRGNARSGPVKGGSCVRTRGRMSGLQSKDWMLRRAFVLLLQAAIHFAAAVGVQVVYACAGRRRAWGRDSNWSGPRVGGGIGPGLGRKVTGSAAMAWGALVDFRMPATAGKAVCSLGKCGLGGCGMGGCCGAVSVCFTSRPRLTCVWPGLSDMLLGVTEANRVRSDTVSRTE